MTTPVIPNHKSGLPQIWEILTKYPTHPLEVLGGFSAIIRGTWYFIFAAEVHSTPVSTYLESVWPIPVWALLLTTGGILQLWALAAKQQQMRFAVSAMLTGLVAALLVGYAIHDYENIAVTLYMTMLTKQVWITLRSRTPFNIGRRPIVNRDDPATHVAN